MMVITSLKMILVKRGSFHNEKYRQQGIVPAGSKSRQWTKPEFLLAVKPYYYHCRKMDPGSGCWNHPITRQASGEWKNPQLRKVPKGGGWWPLKKPIEIFRPAKVSCECLVNQDPAAYLGPVVPQSPGGCRGEILAERRTWHNPRWCASCWAP